MAIEAAALLRFADFEIDEAACELRRGGRVVPLQEQPFRILRALVAAEGKLVTREELCGRLWPGGVHVDFERGLNVAIRRLREALGDTADTARYVETIPRHGYRLLPPVVRVSGAPAQRPSIAVTPFCELTGGPDAAAVAGAFTDDLVTELGRVTSLRVTGSRSDRVLEGSVRPAGARVRIAARLLDGWTGVPVWARSYDREAEDASGAAREVARDVALETLPPHVAFAGTSSADGRSPYPGLASFTERDAPFFFGREPDAAVLWERIRARPLVAVVGASGAGKTSFVRAGVVPGRPDGWAAICVTPGTSPFRNLRVALSSELTSDAALQRLIVDAPDGEDLLPLFARWRAARSGALLVVDQLEELFTLTPGAERPRFADLLARLAAEMDVRVVLSLRDDFLMRCVELPPLRGVFDALHPVAALSREALRRALVEPLKRTGHRFEDDALVDEIVASVDGERAALPLLAFAMSRLWERRDGERRLLTRAAYAEIGGVAGALARHAEATLDRVGAGRRALVREIFRELVTAQGTRAIVDREELLSAVRDRNAAGAVLATLVDARLLTTYEEEDGRQRVEVVHESLLAASPSLVRWRTQDADGAQLRHQLRQAAHLWRERGRADDLLWNGSSYLDFHAWRSRNPEPLSPLEEEFTGAMRARAERTRRRRRAAAAGAMAALLAALAVMAMLFRSSELGARRAEAAKLLALAEVALENDPAAALAYAEKSLELDDTEAARFLALRVTQDGPVAHRMPGAEVPRFSPDGSRLAVLSGASILLFGDDGAPPVTFPLASFDRRAFQDLAFASDGRTLAVGFSDELRILSLPDGREVLRRRYGQPVRRWRHFMGGLAANFDGKRVTLFRRPWDGRDGERIGTLELADRPTSLVSFRFTSDGRLMSYPLGRRVVVQPIVPWPSPPRVVGEHPTDVLNVELSTDGRRVLSVDASGEVRVWDACSASRLPLRILAAPSLRGPSSVPGIWYSRGGRWIEGDSGADGHAALWLRDLSGPPGAAPLVLRSNAAVFGEGDDDPRDRARAALGAKDAMLGGDDDAVLFWRLPSAPSRVFEWREGRISGVAFTGDGTTLIAVTTQGRVRAWPLSSGSSVPFRDLPGAALIPTIAASPAGSEIAVGSALGRLQLLSADRDEARELSGFPETSRVSAVAFSPDGLRVAAAPTSRAAAQRRIHVWELATGAERVLDPLPGADGPRGRGFESLSFVDSDRILASVGGEEENGLWLFDLRDGGRARLAAGVDRGAVFCRTAGVGIGLAREGKGFAARMLRFSLAGSAPVPLPHRFEEVGLPAVDPTGTLVASAAAGGVVRVGPISGSEPHLLFGHRAGVYALAFSPDGKWLASAGNDQTVRLWRVPDVTKVPPHKRSREEFLATLRTFKNVRAVRDSRAPNGWRLEAGPLPGWRDAPHW